MWVLHDTRAFGNEKNQRDRESVYANAKFDERWTVVEKCDWTKQVWCDGSKLFSCFLVSLCLHRWRYFFPPGIVKWRSHDTLQEKVRERFCGLLEGRHTFLLLQFSQMLRCHILDCTPWILLVAFIRMLGRLVHNYYYLNLNLGKQAEIKEKKIPRVNLWVPNSASISTQNYEKRTCSLFQQWSKKCQPGLLM